MDSQIDEQIYSPIEKTEDVTDKKCPNCAATVVYDPATRGMLCEYCGYRKELPAADSGDAVVELDFDAAEHLESFDWGVDKKVVICSSCAGESVYDALETAAVCAFCGSTNVMPSATEKSIAPGGVCPFEIPINNAGELFGKWLKRKIFTPSAAKRQAKPESFVGVYLPYWTFDTSTTSTFSGQAGFDRRVKRGDRVETVTDWRRVSGIYQEMIDDFTVVASKKNESSGVKRAEPFVFSKLVPYRPELVAGFVAERYSVGLKDGWTKAQSGITERLKRNIEGYIKKKWNADRARCQSLSTVFDNVTYKYILVPVWLSSFTYKNKVYQFVVNGQTGKVGGKAPISALRVAIAILLGIILLALILNYS